MTMLYGVTVEHSSDKQTVWELGSTCILVCNFVVTQKGRDIVIRWI